jgi:hypothetical protein
MKTLKLILVITALFFAGTMQAQVSLNVNFGSPPQWGPSGYSNDVRYYYLPDVEAYYDIQTSMFIYYDNGFWVRRAYLPRPYRNYDLYGGYKVVMMDYHGESPYYQFKEHKHNYAKGYRGHEQKNIGERPRNENHQAKKAVKNNQDKKDNKNGNSRGDDKKDQKIMVVKTTTISTDKFRIETLQAVERLLKRFLFQV